MSDMLIRVSQNCMHASNVTTRLILMITWGFTLNWHTGRLAWKGRIWKAEKKKVSDNSQGHAQSAHKGIYNLHACQTCMRTMLAFNLAVFPCPLIPKLKAQGKKPSWFLAFSPWTPLQCRLPDPSLHIPGQNLLLWVEFSVFSVVTLFELFRREIQMSKKLKSCYTLAWGPNICFNGVWHKGPKFEVLTLLRAAYDT